MTKMTIHIPKQTQIFIFIKYGSENFSKLKIDLYFH